MKEVSEEVKKLADVIATKMSYNPEANMYSADKDAFKECIPESLTEQLIREVNDYQTNYVAAAGLAFGEAAIRTLKSDSKLDRVNGEFSMHGRNKAEFVLDRSRTYDNRLGDGEKVQKFGVLSTTYHVKTGRNVGDLAAIKAHLNEMAAKALK